MKYGIYNGFIVEINSDNNRITIFDDGEELYISGKDIIYIKDDDFKLVETELILINQELKNITGRMHRLEDEYQKKKELYREMLVDARSKEMAIINKLLRGRIT